MATGKLSLDVSTQIVKGIAKGCIEAGCALIGGETAEMPAFYKEGEYDLAGFVVGVVEKKKIIDGSKIKAGDQLIGLASSGLHSNGYSLVRKVVFEHLGLSVKDRVKGIAGTIGEELLVPTRIYVKPILGLLKEFPVHGLAHITGGGITDNLPRVIPSGCKAVVWKGSWPVHPIFHFLQEAGNIAEQEMLRTFNNGLGMVLVVSPRDTEKTLNRLKSMGEKAYPIGEVLKAQKSEDVMCYI